MKGQQIVNGRGAIAKVFGKGFGAIGGKARSKKRQIKRGIPLGNRARSGVRDFLAKAEILEKITGAGLAHVVVPPSAHVGFKGGNG